VLQPLISFVVSWTQSLIESNAVTKQLHPKCLTWESIPHPYFWDGGQARFHALSSSHHSTYSRWGSYQALVVASQWVRCRPAARSIFEPHDNHEWRSGLVETGLFLWVKAFLHMAPLRFAKCACTGSHPGDTLCDEAFESLHGRSSCNSEQTHDHCV